MFAGLARAMLGSGTTMKMLVFDQVVNIEVTGLLDDVRDTLGTKRAFHLRRDSIDGKEGGADENQRFHVGIQV